MIDIAIAQGKEKKYTNMPCFDFVPSTAWKVSVFGVFLIRIFPHSEIYSVNPSFSPNPGKCGPEKRRTWTLFYAVQFETMDSVWKKKVNGKRLMFSPRLNYLVSVFTLCFNTFQCFACVCLFTFWSFRMKLQLFKCYSSCLNVKAHVETKLPQRFVSVMIITTSRTSHNLLTRIFNGMFNIREKSK